jgi:hypothetical protein
MTMIISVQMRARAVEMARAARPSAPRAEATFPPCSLVAAITGAAGRADHCGERVQVPDEHRFL